MKDLCQKWKVKLFFRGVWNSLMSWADWPWSASIILRQFYATAGSSCQVPTIVHTVVKHNWIIHSSYQICNRYSMLWRRVTKGKWLIVKEFPYTFSIGETHHKKTVVSWVCSIHRTEWGKFAAFIRCPKPTSLSPSEGRSLSDPLTRDYTPGPRWGLSASRPPL